MGTGNFWLYLLVMFGVTYLIRVLPFVAFHRKIENKYVRSFWHISLIRCWAP